MASANQEEGIKIFGATITLQSRSARVQVVNPIQDELAKEDDPRIKENPTVISVDQVRRPEKVIPCPRCKSMETKFCYFNNYNVNQPRHFCKGCQRYWTAGGALRNVPVGAGRRKIKAPISGHGGVGGGVCLYDGLSGVHQFEFDGSVVMEEWHVATVHDGVRGDFPAKRRRSDSSGCQTC